MLAKPTDFYWLALFNVGAGLLAKAVCQPLHLLLKDRFREQARSHTDGVRLEVA